MLLSNLKIEFTHINFAPFLALVLLIFLSLNVKELNGEASVYPVTQGAEVGGKSLFFKQLFNANLHYQSLATW